MRTWILTNLAPILCFLVLVSRLGDVLSTWLATPTLLLESNALVRRYGWKLALLSTLLCLVPFIHTGTGVTILVVSLLATASNAGKIWLARALGEEGCHQLLLDGARHSVSFVAFAGQAASSLFMTLSGIILFVFYPDPHSDWGFWFAFGILVYGLAGLIHGLLYFRQLFREAGESESLG